MKMQSFKASLPPVDEDNSAAARIWRELGRRIEMPEALIEATVGIASQGIEQ